MGLTFFIHTQLEVSETFSTLSVFILLLHQSIDEVLNSKHTKIFPKLRSHWDTLQLTWIKGFVRIPKTKHSHENLLEIIVDSRRSLEKPEDLDTCSTPGRWKTTKSGWDPKPRWKFTWIPMILVVKPLSRSNYTNDWYQTETWTLRRILIRDGMWGEGHNPEGRGERDPNSKEREVGLSGGGRKFPQ